MKESIILSDDKKDKFCKELNLNTNASKVLITINKNKAEYYNFDDDCYYELDLEVAKKYI